MVTSPVEGAVVLVGDITHDSTIEEITGEIAGGQLNCVISDISPRLTGRYDTDQAISLELSTMALDVASDLLAPGGGFVTKVFQGAGIEGLVGAAKLRFSSVGRFSPTASRSASSETYLVCQRKLPEPKKEGSAMQHVEAHLASIGIVVDEDIDQEIDSIVGFRKLPKKE